VVGLPTLNPATSMRSGGCRRGFRGVHLGRSLPLRAVT
jgi:hypothetical protein